MLVSEPSLAVIPPQLFRDVQGVLDEKNGSRTRGQGGRYQGRRPGATSSPYLLSGLLVCGICKAKMSVFGSGKTSPRTGRVYRGGAAAMFATQVDVAG